MNKSILLTIVFFAGLIAVILSLTLGSAKVTCEVCMEFEGRRGCKTVSGKEKDFVLQTARDNICAELAGRREDEMRCSHQQMASVSCSEGE